MVKVSNIARMGIKEPPSVPPRTPLLAKCCAAQFQSRPVARRDISTQLPASPPTSARCVLARGISASMTVAFLAMGVGAFGWGWVSDRHGPRIVGIAGGLLLGTGLVLASRATSLLVFQ